MTTEVLTQRSQIDRIREDWNRLARIDRRDGYFRTPEWCLAWMEHIRPEDELFVVTVRDSAGAVVGIAPLCRATFRDRAVRLNAITPMGREVVSGDYLDYACAPEHREEVLSAVLECLWNARSRWDLLVGGEVIEDGDLDKAIGAMASRQGLPIRRQEQRACLFIETPPTWEDYLQSLSPNMRYKIRRDTRDLLERAGATIQVYTEPAEVCANLDTMIALHLAHWQSRGLPGTMARPGFGDCLKQVFAAPPQGAETRLYILRHQGKAVAALLAFCWGENMMFYQSGWDPDSSVTHRSPGIVMLGRAIRDSIEGKFRYFDFLRGDETYKTRLTTTSRRTVTLLVGRTFLAKEYLRALRLKDSVKKALGGADAAAAPVCASAAGK